MPSWKDLNKRVHGNATGCCCCCWSLLYSAILRSRADTLRSHVILHEWLAFYAAFLDICIEVAYLRRCLTVTLLVARETAAISVRSVYTIQPCTMSRHFMQSHIRRVHACLVVTSHLPFWQNDRDLLRATRYHGGGTDTGMRLNTES